MLEGFFAYLHEQVANHSGYALGALGQLMTSATESWVKLREHFIKSNYTRALNFIKKQLGLGYTKARVFDCNGLGNYFFLTYMKSVWPKRKNANGMLHTCTQITRAQVLPGDWTGRVNWIGKLFRGYHIGYVTEKVTDTGVPIAAECYGRDKGCIERPIDVLAGNGKSYWNFFGRPAIFKQEIEARAKANQPAAPSAPPATPVQPSQPVINPVTYKIEKGDTLEGIAKAFTKKLGVTVTVDSIMKLNPQIKEASFIYADDEIRIR